jgi:hypothetical protein
MYCGPSPRRRHRLRHTRLTGSTAELELHKKLVHATSLYKLLDSFVNLKLFIKFGYRSTWPAISMIASSPTPLSANSVISVWRVVAPSAGDFRILTSILPGRFERDDMASRIRRHRLAKWKQIPIEQTFSTGQLYGLAAGRLKKSIR